MIRRTSFAFLLISFLLVGCHSKQENSGGLKSKVINFIENSEDIIGFGYVDFQEVKNKGKINELEEVGSFLNQQITALEESINLSEKVHIAFQGPTDASGRPKTIYSFVQIKNLTKLQHLFEDMGFFLEQEGSLSWFDNEGLAIGHDEHYLIIVSTKANADSKSLLIQAFDELYKEKKNLELEKYLSHEADIILLAKLENVLPEFTAYNQKLSSDKREEIEELTKDGYLSFSLSFNKGNIESEFALLNTNEELNELLFFQDEVEDELFNYLGESVPLFTLAMAIDMNKFDHLLSLLYPQTPRELFRSFGYYGILLEGLAGEQLANVTNGNLGVFVPLQKTNGTFKKSALQMNSIMGWGKEKQNMLDLAESLAEEGTFKDLGDGIYRYENSIFKTEKDFLLYHHNDSLKKDFAAIPFIPTENMKKFHKYPFSLYFDMKNHPIELPFPDEVISSIRLIDHVNISANNKVTHIHIAFKEQEKNALEQLLNALEEDLRKRIQGGS